MDRTRFITTRLLAVVAGIALAAATVPAQTKDNVVVSGEMAKRMLTKGEISADAAERIAHIYVEFAKKHNYPGVVYILDPFGNIVHAHRMDGARPIQIDGAITKARTALYYRTTTHELAQRIEKNPAEAIGMWLEEFHPTPGGVPIVLDGRLIGALGVTGSDPWDEEGAYTALHEVLGIPMPSAETLKWEVPPPGQTRQAPAPR
jgi:glc operon protein GlcG